MNRAGQRESQFWHHWVKDALSGWDPYRVETGGKDGFPDVCHIHGLMELKDAVDWPAKDGTSFKLDHFSPQQRVFAKRRWKAGGLCHVLLRVNQTVLLIPGNRAADWLGKMPKDQTISLASTVFEGKYQMQKGLKNEILADAR